MTRNRDESPDSLPPWLQEALATLPEATEPPASLQRRVLRALERAGELRTPRSRWLTGALVPRLAAALLVLALGFGLGWLHAGVPNGGDRETAKGRWILILYEGAAYASASLPSREDRVREYSAWARRLGAAGALESAGELPEEGVLLESLGGRVVEAATLPRSEVGIVAGYFLLRADSREEALALARDCPFLRHGGKISLRRVETG